MCACVCSGDVQYVDQQYCCPCSQPFKCQKSVIASYGVNPDLLDAIADAAVNGEVRCEALTDELIKSSQSRKRWSNGVIATHTVTAGGLGFVPMPLVDTLMLIPIMVSMLSIHVALYNRAGLRLPTGDLMKGMFRALLGHLTSSFAKGFVVLAVLLAMILADATSDVLKWVPVVQIAAVAFSVALNSYYVACFGLAVRETFEHFLETKTFEVTQDELNKVFVQKALDVFKKKRSEILEEAVGFFFVFLFF